MKQVGDFQLKLNPNGRFTNAITFIEILDSKPEMIYYGANTCWWTHDVNHIYRHPRLRHLPCDPSAGVLYQTDDVKGFFVAAAENATHYGKHGLRAFVAAHHLNCVVSAQDTRPTCFDNWQAYNDILDRWDQENG